jgi:TonB family protein
VPLLGSPRKGAEKRGPDKQERFDELTLGSDIPEKIDRYEIIEPKGFGAMGAVYKAFDPIIKRPVALKTIRLDIPPSSPDYRAFLDRFDVEARTAGRLSHPNIVTLYDVGYTADKIPWLAMEYVDGETVAELLQGEKLKPEVVIGFVSQIASAIDYAHSEGVVHRDIKPSNVIVYGGEKVKVTDFGIAKLMDADVTHSGLMMGTPSYMSPEQAMGEDLDGSTDIFSLGVVAFEMLSGQQPFPGNNVTSILYKLVHSDPVQPDDLEVLGLLPDKWHEVFFRVLAKNPTERYPTAAAFVQQLELCLGSWFGGLGEETLIANEASALPPTSPVATGDPEDEDATVVLDMRAQTPPGMTAPGAMAEGAAGAGAASPPRDETDDSDETLVVGPPPGATLPDTATIARRSLASDETSTAALPQDLLDQLESEAGADPTAITGAPDPAVERTLYADPAAPGGPSEAADQTLVPSPAPASRPSVTVTIRKPSGLRAIVVPIGVGVLVGIGLLAFLLTRGSAPTPTPPPEPPPEPPPVVAETGSLRVTSEPLGARVLLNGDDRGVTPLEIGDLPLGAYEVRVEQEGFQGEVLHAELSPEVPLATVDVSLEPEPKAPPPPPAPAFFAIKSTPAGALVQIDGRDVGNTPLNRVRVSPGARVVRVLQDGFLPWEDEFRARSGRTESIDAILTPRGGTLGSAAEEPDEPEFASGPPPVVLGQLVERGEPGVSNPRCIQCPAVPYPEAARRSRLQGVVELSFLIDENGVVRDPEIIESGDEIFDNAVLATVQGWRYEPATKHGVRVKIRWVQRFRFQQGR